MNDREIDFKCIGGSNPKPIPNRFFNFIFSCFQLRPLATLSGIGYRAAVSGLASANWNAAGRRTLFSFFKKKKQAQDDTTSGSGGKQSGPESEGTHAELM